jgi:hypothetical protein
MATDILLSFSNPSQRLDRFFCLRFAPALFGASPRDRFVGCDEARFASRHPFGASILSKRQSRECAVRFPVTRR